MKRYAYIALALLIGALATAGCARQSQAAGEERLSIVTTIFAPYDFARQIVGDGADVSMLLPPGSESHSFEPTPQDIIKIQNSDAFIYVGGESDAWVDDVLSSMDTANMRIITLMDCVEAVEEEHVEGMQADDHEDEDDHEDDDEDGHGHEYDEHVWTSPRNAKRIVQKIAESLREADPANADAYAQNAAAYQAQLDALDAQFQTVVDAAARKTIVFGDRFPFRYFADAYGLDYFAAFPGCSTETEASAATVKFLIDKVRDERIPVVFHVELSNARMADAIAEDTGASVRLLHACHNISKADFEAGRTYLDIMAANVDALKEALQ